MEFNVNGIRDILFDSGVYSNIFDTIRIIEAKTGAVCEIRDSQLVKTEEICSRLTKRDDRCKVCVPMRSLYTNEQTVRLEYMAGSVYLVFSVPFNNKGETFVAELSKNITNTMSLDDNEGNGSNDVLSIIDKLNKLATTDELTNLMNRRYADEKLPGILRSSRQLKQPISIALIDIDHFKSVNDNYGHPAGDYMLEKISEILKSFIRRNSDFAARYGGEEFLLCFPGMPIKMCCDICEKIRCRIEKSVFLYNGVEMTATISIGVAESNIDTNDTPERLIAAADKKLYESKASGRNMVRC